MNVFINLFKSSCLFNQEYWGTGLRLSKGQFRLSDHICTAHVCSGGLSEILVQEGKGYILSLGTP